MIKFEEDRPLKTICFANLLDLPVGIFNQAEAAVVESLGWSIKVRTDELNTYLESLQSFATTLEWRLIELSEKFASPKQETYCVTEPSTPTSSYS